MILQGGETYVDGEAYRHIATLRHRPVRGGGEETWFVLRGPADEQILVDLERLSAYEPVDASALGLLESRPWGAGGEREIDVTGDDPGPFTALGGRAVLHHLTRPGTDDKVAYIGLSITLVESGEELTLREWPLAAESDQRLFTADCRADKVTARPLALAEPPTEEASLSAFAALLRATAVALPLGVGVVLLSTSWRLNLLNVALLPLTAVLVLVLVGSRVHDARGLPAKLSALVGVRAVDYPRSFPYLLVLPLGVGLSLGVLWPVVRLTEAAPAQGAVAWAHVLAICLGLAALWLTAARRQLDRWVTPALIASVLPAAVLSLGSLGGLGAGGADVWIALAPLASLLFWGVVLAVVGLRIVFARRHLATRPGFRQGVRRLRGRLENAASPLGERLPGIAEAAEALADGIRESRDESIGRLAPLAGELTLMAGLCRRLAEPPLAGRLDERAQDDLAHLSADLGGVADWLGSRRGARPVHLRLSPRLVILATVSARDPRREPLRFWPLRWS